MEEQNAYVIELLNKFEEKKATAEEVEILFAYLRDERSDETTRKYLESRMQQYVPLREDVEYWKSRLWENQLPEKLTASVTAQLPVVEKKRPSIFGHTLLRYAAAVLIILGCATYLIYKAGSKKESFASGSSRKPAIHPTDKAPGGNRAVLTLSNGSKIILDTSASGVLANESGTVVQKTAHGSILYDGAASAPGAIVLYNTMTTPRGGQYQLTLADGTRVWLNAASSITFPTSFIGKERMVSITGEAYFEVARNSKQNFRIQVNHETEINVLGTHFNINAYLDESSVNTTLVEGSLEVKFRDQPVRLVAGNQAQVRKSGIQLIKDVNTQQVVAWKNGAFSFNKDNLDAVLRQVSRWYDVGVIYEKDAPKRVFSGKMGRNLALSQILKFLKDIDVNIKLEQNNIIVMK